MAESIKETVRQTSGRKITAQASRRHAPVIKIAPKGSSASNDDRESSSSRSDSSLHQTNASTATSEDGALQKDGVRIMQDESIVSKVISPGLVRADDSQGPSLAVPEDHMAGPRSIIPAHESALMMHFLDSVFPLQYPMYNPDITNGGRGWLLNLLLGSKPFYHAALALSAHHRRMTMSASSKNQVAALVQQEQHLEISLKAMKVSTQNSCSINGLGIASTVAQLVFYELFTGDINACLAHLRAAIGMTGQAFEQKNFGKLGLVETARKVVHENLPIPENEPEAAEQVTNFRFLTGATIWLDITSSITTGIAPQLLPWHSTIIASNSQTKLEDIMGCQNWVMLQVGRIAALHERCAQAAGRGDFNCTEFHQIAFDITLSIQDGLTQAALEGFGISENELAGMVDTIPKEHTLVTHIFALMASTYLHLVIHGFQELEVLDNTITKAMSILQAELTRRLLPALVAPLYIIGVVARPGDKPFFREVLSSLPLLDSSLKHRKRILPVLEEIWRERERAVGLTWNDSLGLATDIFLL